MSYEVTFGAPTEGAKVGRPTGTMRPATLEIRYPIRWRPIYDLFVADTLAGLSQKAIGEKHNYSAVQVGNVLRSPIGQAKFTELRAKIEELSVKQVTTFEDTAKRIKEKAFLSAEKFLDDEKGLATSLPLAYIDRAIRIAALNSAPPVGSTTNVQINNQRTLVISSEAAANVAEALKLSREVFSSVDNAKVLSVEAKVLSNPADG
jgi:hypothetical protein